MPQVRLTDAVYKTAHAQAAARGFASVEDYVADLVEQGMGDAAIDLDALFTAECLTAIDEAAADVDAGHFLTQADMDDSLSEHRQAWARKDDR